MSADGESFSTPPPSPDPDGGSAVPPVAAAATAAPPKRAGFYHCAVCLHDILPWRGPTFLKDASGRPACTHIFCAKCVERAGGSCPVCRQAFKEASELAEFPLLWKLYREAAVDCPSGCGARCEAQDLLAHCEACEKRTVCGKCEAVVLPPETLEDHLEAHCPETETQCKSDRCHFKCARRQMEDHSKDCPRRIVGCTYPFCGHTGPFEEQESHVQGGTQQHLVLALNQLSVVEKKLGDSSKSVETLNSMLQATITRRARILVKKSDKAPAYPALSTATKWDDLPPVNSSRVFEAFGLTFKMCINTTSSPGEVGLFLHFVPKEVKWAVVKWRAWIQGNVEHSVGPCRVLLTTKQGWGFPKAIKKEMMTTETGVLKQLRGGDYLEVRVELYVRDSGSNEEVEEGGEERVGRSLDNEPPWPEAPF
ncbi:hypothetical protein DFJ74DRAFT_766503 [Hyaloraphidium curvatum]|nr:hypothetical protein DFJ74DRAFT_766503 [Hyaloraphidium curvatum]